MNTDRNARGNAYCRLPTVLAETGLSRSQLYAMIKDGEFPAPYRLSKRAVAWRESELRDWMDSRERAFDLAEAS